MNLSKWIFLFLMVLTEYVLGEMKDPYATLNLPRNAGVKEIKRKYKSLVKEWLVGFDYCS